MRSNAREAAFKIIFSELFQDNAEQSFKTRIFKGENLNDEDVSFAESLVFFVEYHLEELSNFLTEKIDLI